MPRRRVRRRSTLGDHRPTQTRLAPRGGPFEPGDGVVDAARSTGDEVLAGTDDESVDVIRCRGPMGRSARTVSAGRSRS